MATVPICLILLLCFNYSFTYILLESDDPTESISWPSEYHFKGEEIDLVTSIKKPFEIWYSSENNKSRRDFYDGTEKKYYYAETDDEYGKEYYLHPITTEEYTNEIVCIEATLEGDQEDFMPNVEDYVYSGQEVFRDKNAYVWKSEEEIPGKIRYEKVLYVERTDQGVDIPLQLNSKSFNLVKGELKSFEITNFYDFSSSVSEEDLEVDTLFYDCESFGSLGKDLKKDLYILHPDIEGDLNLAFHSYKRHHNRDYKDTEHQIRKKIFEENWSHIVDHNRQNLGYKLQVNEFSDRTDDELKYLTSLIPSNPEKSVASAFPYTFDEIDKIAETIPENFDLRLEGVISRVKDQASCGSCWAFTTTASVEGAIARNNGGRDLDLAEQSLVDCAWGFNTFGCDGGMMDGGMKYVLEHGIPTEQAYGPYLEKDGFCRLENVTDVYKIKGFVHVSPSSINALKVAVYKHGPVSVGIHAGKDLIMYSEGIFYDVDCKGKRLNHGVTVVGYGVRNDVPYWIVKNSWGEAWGEDGYILMSATNDNCGVLENAYYTIV